MDPVFDLLETLEPGYHEARKTSMEDLSPADQAMHARIAGIEGQLRKLRAVNWELLTLSDRAEIGLLMGDVARQAMLDTIRLEFKQSSAEVVQEVSNLTMELLHLRERGTCDLIP